MRHICRRPFGAIRHFVVVVIVVVVIVVVVTHREVVRASRVGKSHGRVVRPAVPNVLVDHGGDAANLRERVGETLSVAGCV